MPEAVPQRLSKPERRRVLGLISERQERPGTRFTDLGSMDAYPEGVIRTIPKSYAQEEGLTEEEAAEDLYEGGGAPDRARFAEKTREMQAVRGQFGGESTGDFEFPLSSSETEREQRVRGGEENGPSEADIAAELDRQRQAMAMAAGREDEEEEAQGASKREGALKQAETAKKTFWRLSDLFNAATAEDIVNGIVLIVEANARLLTMGFKKSSLTRKVFPAAQFPFEAAAIVSFDLLLIPLFLGALTMMLAPFIIFMVVVGSGGTAILSVIDLLGG